MVIRQGPIFSKGMRALWVMFLWFKMGCCDHVCHNITFLIFFVCISFFVFPLCSFFFLAGGKGVQHDFLV